jgi:predicted metal-binding membrane protein
MVALLIGYVTVWAVAGLPVYVYALTAESIGRVATVLPAVLLVIGGVYQFTSLKRSCHARCSSPLFFLMQKWRPGVPGALRLGVLHGVDCLGCCAGVMVGLVALGMMNLALVFTAALIIFAEKTLPESHHIARPLGVLMMAGGVVFLGLTLFGGRQPEMNPQMSSGAGIDSQVNSGMDSQIDSQMNSGMDTESTAGMDSM